MLGIAGILNVIYIILAMAVKDTVHPFFLCFGEVVVLLSFLSTVNSEAKKDKG